jgi:hypothetical protein
MKETKMSPAHVNPCPPDVGFVASRVQTDGQSIYAIDRTSYDGVAQLHTSVNSEASFKYYAWLTRVTTGGSGGVERIGTPGRPGIQEFGSRFVYVLQSKTDANDSVSFDTAFFCKSGAAVSSIIFSLPSDYIVCEGTPNGWEIIYSAPGVVA